MSAPDNDHDELKQQVDAILEERATPEQVSQLEKRLKTDPAARAFYLKYAHMHARILWRFRGESTDRQSLEKTSSKEATLALPAAPRWSMWQWLPLAAGLLFMLGLGVWMLPGPLGFQKNAGLASSTRSDEVATLVDSVNCLWGSSRQPTSVGSRLTSGTIDLAQGMVEIEFDHGARMILTGPSLLEIQSPDRVFLRRGVATCRVPKRAIGFVLQTPSSRVVDLGTEFGVKADDSGASRIHTFDGLVEVESSQDLLDQSARTNSVRNPRQIKAGEQLQIDADGRNARFSATSGTDDFVRRMPQADAETPLGNYARQVLADRPTGFWRFEDSSMTAGAPATDSSGLRHAGNYQGLITSVPGVPGIGGRAAQFDGTSGRVRIPHHPDFSLRSISVEFWLRTDEEWNHKYWPGDAVLVSKEVPGLGTDWTVIGGSLTEGQNEGRCIVGVGAPPRPDQLLPSRPKLNDGTWHHLVWTRDRSGANQLYIDGAIAGSMPDGGGSINNPMDIDIGGTIQSAVSNHSANPVDVQGRALKDRSYLRGEMDEVAIYDHVLPPQRIIEHYQAGK